MDTINLPAPPSTPLNSRNTASNTSPIACACCGSKDYVQTVPHPNYFRTLCHGTSRCKHSQDNCEDKCIVPPFLPSVPLFQPFLQNFSLPPNAYCTHNHLDDAAICLNQISGRNKAENEKKVPHHGDYYAFDQKEKSNVKADDTSFCEKPQKNFAAVGAECQFSAYPLSVPNLKDIQYSPYIQRCACGDTTPWTCSPFIVPIVSYYLLWNSQKCNSTLPSNYPGHQPHIIHPQHNEAPSNFKHSSPFKSEGKAEKNFDIINNHHVTNSSDDENYSSENISENDKKTNRESIIGKKNNLKSSPPMTAYPLNFIEDNSSNITNKSDNCDSQDARMEEAMEVDGFLASEQTESDECLKVDKNTRSNPKVQLLISLDSNDDYLSSNEDLTQSLPSKVHEEYDSSAGHLNPLEAGETLPSLKRSYRKIQDSDEECGKISSEYKTTFDERMSFKKFIKNFNATEKTTSVLSEEEHIYAAAAGDLGGENCVGYKVHISSSETDQQEKMQQETQPEVNLEAKETVLFKGLAEVKEKQPNNFIEKNAETKISVFKSGIAKPSSSQKPKETKELNAKKDNRESSQEESYNSKRPHSCFTGDHATNHSENSLKIHKMKNQTHSGIQQQNQGSGKSQKTPNTKTQFLKKAEVSTSKVRSHITQKHSNTTMKSRKK